MSGLGGLNKSPNGVVLGMVQLQLPVVATPDDLAAQTARIVAMVGKARRNLPTMDLVVFPEYALHGLSMDTNPAIMCSLDGPEVAAFKPGLRRQSHLGLLLHHGAQSRRQPLQFRHRHRRQRRAATLLPQDASVGAGRAVGARQHRDSRGHRAERRQDRAHHLPRRHVPGDGAGMRLQGRRDHDPHRGLHRADPRRLALHQSGECVLQSHGDRERVHVRQRRYHSTRWGRG